MLETSCFNSDELICPEPCWRVCQFWTVIEMSTREILSRAVGLFSLSIYSVIWLILKAVYWLTYTDVLLSSMFSLILFQAAIIIHFILQNLGFSSHYNKGKTKRKRFLVSFSSKEKKWHLKSRLIYTMQRAKNISHLK